MQNYDLVHQYKQIIRLIEDTNSYSRESADLQGHWGKYLCVLVAGFLENAISTVYIDYVSSAASKHVINYTLKQLENIHNPKAQKFIDVASQFKREWGNELTEFFKTNPTCKNAIDSIMKNRNIIAHGGQASISVHVVREYLEESVSAIEFIERQCRN